MSYVRYTVLFFSLTPGKGNPSVPGTSASHSVLGPVLLYTTRDTVYVSSRESAGSGCPLTKVLRGTCGFRSLRGQGLYSTVPQT